MQIEFCSYLEGFYGGRHWIEKNSLGLHTLYIENGQDRFHIHLADKLRFGRYDLYHRNYGRRLDGTWPSHRQLTCSDLSFAIFSAYSHAFSKENGIWLVKEDYHAFMQDWKKFCNSQKENAHESFVQEASCGIHDCLQR